MLKSEINKIFIIIICNILSKYDCSELSLHNRNTIIENIVKNYNQTYYYFTGTPSYKKCIKNNCKYVALCGGGCMMQSYLEKNKINEKNCEYNLFEELIPFLLEENYGTK